jgi:Escherichia/Staphylococcus phage prohead protease
VPGERLYRATPVDLELRGDGRTVVGIAMPFDQPTEIREDGRTFTELFRRGAFTKTIRERGPQAVKTFAKHQRASLPIGRASVLREDPTGLYAELRVSKTVAGDEVLSLIDDGALDGLSIGFAPIKDRQVRGGVERLEVALYEVSVVDYPAYVGATIAGVRSDEHRISPEAAARRLDLLDRTWRT